MSLESQNKSVNTTKHWKQQQAIFIHIMIVSPVLSLLLISCEIRKKMRNLSENEELFLDNFQSLIF
ncbi:hypothetical protein [Neobacillus drentensis]|uniref:hypothetical protein n=1 Tax=Neobacillus drentensis TaxID=220684 RepID=UPI0008253FC5|nr:hypothetical protein [Neobacillus drentensis]